MDSNRISTRNAAIQVIKDFTGPNAWRYWLKVLLRCIFWWSVCSGFTFLLLGGMLLLFFIVAPAMIGNSVPEIYGTVYKLLSLWEQVIFGFISWFMPLISLFSSFIHYFSGGDPF